MAKSYLIEFESMRLGQWYLLILRAIPLPHGQLISVHMELKDGVQSVTRFLRTFTFFGYSLPLIGIVNVPLNLHRMSLRLYGGVVLHAKTSAQLFGISQAVAALILTLSQPRIVLSAFRYSHGGLLERLRNNLAIAAVQTGFPTSYSDWVGMFGHWIEHATNLADTAQKVPVLVLVFKRRTTSRHALAATLKSVRCSTCPTRLVIFDGNHTSADEVLAGIVASALEAHVALLQAGELVEAHAIATLRRVAVQHNRAAVYGDNDALTSEGVRHKPVFKPQPSRTLLMSGLLTQGVHLFERAALEGLSTGAALWAETAKLDAWLRLTTGLWPASGERVPFLLTHRRHDTQTADAPALAMMVRAHLGSQWIGHIDDTAIPLRVRPGVGSKAPKVSLVVASTGRLPHVGKCLRAILADTDYPNFEMVIVISQEVPLDAEQCAVLLPLQADVRVRVMMAQMESFNYSRANNLGISETDSQLICLLNDDVAPIAPDWLSVMVGHMQDPSIGAVGAKLYYPNGTVQHGGVIMGLSGLCDHAFRFLPRGDSGYGGRGIVDHELSAVTGACLLVKRSVYDETGGLDEGFATAFNDVDFCMKIRAAGHGIVWSAQAELYHFETISLGCHYEGERKNLEAVDIGILRLRWDSIIKNDPFHSPNLSLERNSEGLLAFPPRSSEWAERAGLQACDAMGSAL